MGQSTRQITEDGNGADGFVDGVVTRVEKSPNDPRKGRMAVERKPSMATVGRKQALSAVERKSSLAGRTLFLGKRQFVLNGLVAVLRGDDEDSRSTEKAKRTHPFDDRTHPFLGRPHSLEGRIYPFEGEAKKDHKTENPPTRWSMYFLGKWWREDCD